MFSVVDLAMSLLCVEHNWAIEMYVRKECFCLAWTRSAFPSSTGLKMKAEVRTRTLLEKPSSSCKEASASGQADIDQSSECAHFC